MVAENFTMLDLNTSAASVFNSTLLLKDILKNNKQYWSIRISTGRLLLSYRYVLQVVKALFHVCYRNWLKPQGIWEMHCLFYFCYCWKTFKICQWPLTASAYQIDLKIAIWINEWINEFILSKFKSRQVSA